jgi:hypothetical protein
MCVLVWFFFFSFLVCMLVRKGELKSIGDDDIAGIDMETSLAVVVRVRSQASNAMQHHLHSVGW